MVKNTGKNYLILLTVDVEPQPIENVQHTPNPDAQDPAAVPLCTVQIYFTLERSPTLLLILE